VWRKREHFPLLVQNSLSSKCEPTNFFVDVIMGRKEWETGMQIRERKRGIDNKKYTKLK
jgi:hypothetical protein